MERKRAEGEREERERSGMVETDNLEDFGNLRDIGNLEDFEHFGNFENFGCKGRMGQKLGGWDLERVEGRNRGLLVNFRRGHLLRESLPLSNQFHMDYLGHELCLIIDLQFRSFTFVKFIFILISISS